MMDMMPEGITWVRFGVLECARCHAEEDVNGRSAEGAHLHFYARHIDCEHAASGEKRASSMTVREHMAARLMASLTASPTPTKFASAEEVASSAVALADALLEALRYPKELILSDEDFESLVSAARLSNLPTA